MKTYLYIVRFTKEVIVFEKDTETTPQLKCIYTDTFFGPSALSDDEEYYITRSDLYKITYIDTLDEATYLACLNAL